MTQFEPENLTEDQVIALLQMLFTNMNQLDSVYYDMFINTVPMDVTLERYDENGTLQTLTLPNRAKDRTSVLSGIGSPEGVVEGNIGQFYIDTRGRNMYYKTSATSYTGWTIIYSGYNFRAGTDYLTPTGSGSGLTDLSGTNITGGVIDVSVGGTGTTGLTGIIKGNGNLNPYSVATPDIDYALPTSYVGMIAFFGGTTAPTGWLIANGDPVSRTTYARLYNYIGTIYGTGDGSTTFNLPDLRNKFAEGATSSIGTSVAAGLPNITGSYCNASRWNQNYSGALYSGGTGIQGYGRDGYDNNTKIAFDASRSSSIYGKSSTVQPPAVKLLPCIKY